MSNEKCPCLVCKSVKDPQNCTNKCCEQWRLWWVAKWNKVTERLRPFYDKKEV